MVTERQFSRIYAILKRFVSDLYPERFAPLYIHIHLQLELVFSQLALPQGSGTFSTKSREYGSETQSLHLTYN